MTSKFKENIGSIASLAAITSVIVALSSGLFDRGSSNGVINEKILSFERVATRLESSMSKFTDKAESNAEKEAEFRNRMLTDSIKANSEIEKMREELKREKEARIEDIRRLEIAINDLRTYIYRDANR